nr:MAG TPA: GCN4n coiled coil peptide [Caudoviricetes sp.]
MAKTVTTKFELQNIIKNAKKLQDGEKLPIRDHAYGVSVDKNTGDITMVLTVNARDIVKSAKGSNFVIPVANTTSVRGTGVVEAHSDDGLTIRLFTDRMYISTIDLEKEKEVKTAKTSKTAQLEADMQALLKKNEEAEKRAERLENMLAEFLASQNK